MMRIILLSFLLLISTAQAAQKCELNLYQGEKLLQSKSYALPEYSGKNQLFQKHSTRYYEDHKKKYRSIQYNVTSFIEFKKSNIHTLDFIIKREVEEYSINKLPASLFSQIPQRYPLERISIKLKKGLGKKTYQIDSKNSFELSCKKS